MRGGASGQVELTQAARKELVEDYVQGVLIGLKEVEDSLIAESSTRRRSDILIETVAQAREAHQLATCATRRACRICSRCSTVSVRN